MMTRMPGLVPKLSLHMEESVIILENVDLETLGPQEQQRGSVLYQRWVMRSGVTAPPQKAFRSYRHKYGKWGRGPVVIEAQNSTRRDRPGAGPEHWDEIALTVDLLWSGTWSGVPFAEQPGLVVVRPDGGVILSALPAGFRPVIPAVLAFPLLTTHEIARAYEHLARRVPRAKTRSDMLTLLEHQGLLLRAPEALQALYAEITRPGSGRSSGRQAAVYLSLPAYALAITPRSARDRWEQDPAGLLKTTMESWAAEVERTDTLVQRLQKQGLWPERPAEAGPTDG